MMKEEILLPVIRADNSNFSDYGRILEKPGQKPIRENEYMRYWHRTIPMDGFSSRPVAGYFQTKKVNPVCTVLECILTNDEAYISFGESSLVLFAAKSGPDGAPAEDGLKAFLFEKGRSPVVKKGIWHWSPFPLDCDNSFLLVLGGGNFVESGEELDTNGEEVKFHDLKRAYTIDVPINKANKLKKANK
jgi:ureidoglycolate hydrolase